MAFTSIGGIELNSVAIGMHAADEMIKAATVTLLFARPTCPGRYLVMVSGDTGAVESSVATGRQIGGELLIDWFMLANMHPSVLPAMSSTGIVPEIDALGVIETCTVTSAVLAADAAVKAAQISLVEIRFAAGLAGKSYVTMTGDVGSVQASVQAGLAGIGESGPAYSHVVIPSPSAELKQHLM